MSAMHQQNQSYSRLRPRPSNEQQLFSNETAFLNKPSEGTFEGTTGQHNEAGARILNVQTGKTSFKPQVDGRLEDREPVFSEADIAQLYRAKCDDLKIKMYPQQFMRFRDSMNKLCNNRKCNLENTVCGPRLIHSLREFVAMDRISVLDLSKNSIGDQGAFYLMHVVASSTSLVSLNLASNEISGRGMEAIFDGLMTNQSIISLDISSIEGAIKNRFTKGAALKLKEMLCANKHLELLNLAGLNLGDEGMKQLANAFCQCLEDQANQKGVVQVIPERED